MNGASGVVASKPLHLPSPGDVIANRYRIDALLGYGGMGAAFSASNLVTGKQVALKWLLHEKSAARLQRVLREARAGSRVRHPNIVDVYDVGEHAGSLFLVMELLVGESLQSLIDRRAPLPATELLGFMLPVMHAMRALHRSGVIHRDLKPANIFLSQAEPGVQVTPKVLDFGVSKIVSSGEPDDGPSLTDSGELLGTPSYMAPEQLERSRSVDQRADVYACGVILYHALSARRPFEAENLPQLMSSILEGTPQPLAALRPELSADLCEVVQRAMHRDLEQRHPDMEALIHALEPFAGEHARRPAQDTLAPSAARPHRRLWWSVLIAVIAVALVVWALARPQPSDRLHQPAPSAAAPTTPPAPATSPPPAQLAPAPAVGPEPTVPAGAEPPATTAPEAPAPDPTPARRAREPRPPARSGDSVVPLGREDF
jgi:serine/threonine protein kinase